MSRETISKDLYSLIPGWTSALPADLVNLTSSLLAQSRSKAGNLKKDEEIARGYVCANIACERLKRTLDLPDINARPPVASRTYKKVYQYLDAALKSTVPKRQQQSNGNSAPSTPNKARKHGTTTTATPATNRSAARQTSTHKSKTTLPHRSIAKTQASQIPRSATSKASGAGASYITPKTPDLDFPPWIMQSIRAICNAWSQPQAIPHIFAGVSSVARHLARQSPSSRTTPLTASKSSAQRARAKARSSTLAAGTAQGGKFPLRLIAPLTFTIAIYTDTQFGSAPTDQEEYFEKRSQVYSIFERFAPSPPPPASNKMHTHNSTEESDDEADELAHDDNDDSSNGQEKLLMPEGEYEEVCEEYNALADKEWLSMEWYGNVCEAAEVYKSQAPDRDAGDDGAMDVDSASASAHGEHGPHTPSRAKRRDRASHAPGTLSEDAGDDDDDYETLQRSKRHKRNASQMAEAQRGGEMMLARRGWLDSPDEIRAYEKWAASARKRIAAKKREMGVAA